MINGNYLLGYDQPITFYLEVNVFSFQVFQDSGKAQIPANLPVGGVVGWGSGGVFHLYIIPSCQLPQYVIEAGASEVEEPPLPGSDLFCIDVPCNRHIPFVIQDTLFAGG